MAPLIIPAISLIAEAVPQLLKLFGKDSAAEVADKVIGIAQSVTGAGTPDEAIAAIKTDPAIALQFKTAVMSHQSELERIALEREQLYVTDTADARKYRDNKTFWLGIGVLATFAVVIAFVLYGGYEILRGGVSVEAGMFAAVTGFIGTLVGYVAANAQQVVGFFFGSSKGSNDKTDAMADAIKSFKRE